MSSPAATPATTPAPTATEAAPAPAPAPATTASAPIEAAPAPTAAAPTPADPVQTVQVQEVSADQARGAAVPTPTKPKKPSFAKRLFSILKNGAPVTPPASSSTSPTASRKSLDVNAKTMSATTAKTPEIFVGSIDQGTSSSRFMIFNQKGEIVTMHQMEFEQIYPQAGWCEHDPEVIMDSVNQCIAEVAKKLEAMGHSISDIKAIGITNQRETTVVWDKITGKPLHHAIVWLDGRTKSTVAKLVEKSESKTTTHLQQKCGLPFSTYFSGVKLRWLLDNVDAVKKAHDEGRLAFGTIDSWLIYNLTGGVTGGKHVSDVTNASRTMFMNIHTLQWDEDILKFFDVKREILPEIVSSAEEYGKVVGGPLAGLPLAGCLGDQQAAVVGQRCFNPGEVKNTYGTGCFMLFNTGTDAVISKHGLLTTVGYKLGKDADAVYALEGSVAIAGAAIKWLRDNLKMIESAAEINELAAKVENTGGVYFVPAFSGLFAPHWRDDARGCIVGLTQYATREHIARATLEAVCFQSKEVLDAMNADAGTDLAMLKVDGGMTNSDLGMQIQADLLGISVERPAMRETTALGAALAAGLTVGVWKDLNDFAAGEKPDVFEPKIEAKDRADRYADWKKAVERSLNWV